MYYRLNLNNKTDSLKNKIIIDRKFSSQGSPVPDGLESLVQQKNNKISL